MTMHFPPSSNFRLLQIFDYFFLSINLLLLLLDQILLQTVHHFHFTISFCGILELDLMSIREQELFRLQYNKKFQQMKTVKVRQISSEGEKRTQKLDRKQQMPFHIQRQQYKELIPYEKKGHWSQKEKLKYVVFLEYFKQRFEIKAKRRFNNIFDLMAIFIKTRNPHQCRSHHQKMQKQKFRIDSILTTTASKYHPRVFQQLRQRYITEIQALDIDEEENFEKFKERIEKIQMKKKIERQIMINNRRILRSSKNSEEQKHTKVKKLFESKKRDNKLKTYNQPPPLQQIQIKEERIDDIYEEKAPLKVSLEQRIQKQRHIDFLYPNLIQSNLKNLECPQFSFGGRNPIQEQLYVRLQKLENRKKHHLDLAHYHYTEYMRHLGEANRLQFQMMRQTGVPPNGQLFLDPHSLIKTYEPSV